MNIETLDKMYLEISQFTRARTYRETLYLTLLKDIIADTLATGEGIRNTIRQFIDKEKP